ncbi:hypothetical protein FRC08_016218, partial [Ceratobasidium sp. 394]
PSKRASEGLLVLSLLTLGEIARFVDIKSRQNLLDNVSDFFASDSEHIREAATLATAYICIGSPKKFLSVVMDQAKNDKEQRPFLMRALEEFVSDCSPDELKKQYGDELWEMCWNLPLQHHDALDSCASCMSRIFSQNPGFILPRLDAGIKDPDPIIRALVVSIMGCVFQRTAEETGDEKDWDDDDNEGTGAQIPEKEPKAACKSLLTALSSSLDDKDLGVKAKTLSAFNQAVCAVPRLVESQLAQLHPKLCDAARLKTKSADRGLEVLFAAYEVINTLINTPRLVAKLDLDALLTTVLHGLSDESGNIKTLCHTILQRLAQTAPVV